MARLLVVSRSMALAMRIADDHDVVEYPVEGLDELAPEPGVDAVVLDLGEPKAAMQTLDRLRSSGCDTPVLIVSGYQPAWNDIVPLELPGVVVVPLPITRAALLDGVDRLLGVTPFVPRVAPAPAGPGAPPPVRGTTPDGDGPPPALPVRPVPAGGRRSPTAAPPSPPPGLPLRPAALASTGGAAEPVQALPSGGDEAAGHDGTAGTPSQGRRRPGLARWLTTAPARPPHSAPQGSPLDGGQAALRGGPTVAPTPDEQDLFRPVVEPQVPLRSPATLPARPAGAPRPALRPAAPAPAPQVAPPPAPQVAPPPAAPAPPAARGPVTAPPPAPARPEPLAPRESGPPPAPARPYGPGPATKSPGKSRGRGRDAREQHPGFTPAAGLHAAPPLEAPSDAVHVLARMLLDRRAELFGVTETAQVLADEVIERGEADAAAILVPDGARWRVSGGVGLRPLERRLLLDTSHWLISEIAVGGRALLIEDTDIVRPRLAGAPLAAWRHLLAVPVPAIRAAVVLARGQEAARFTEKDLAAVVPVVSEAGPLLQAALLTRELARSMGPLRDLE